MVLRRRHLLAVIVASVISCHDNRVHSPKLPSPVRLSGVNGDSVSLPDDFERSALTVLLFYAEECPVFRVHEERVRALARVHEPRGVRFLLVASEASATLHGGEATRARGLPPFFLDPEGRVADAYSATQAGYVVVVDRRGEVRYRGGIDSDRNRLTPDAKAWLGDALDDLVAGREPRRSETKALGCVLRR